MTVKTLSIYFQKHEKDSNVDPLYRNRKQEAKERSAANGILLQQAYLLKPPK
jgi:hypothetical protein